MRALTAHSTHNHSLGGGGKMLESKGTKGDPQSFLEASKTILWVSVVRRLAIAGPWPQPLLGSPLWPTICGRTGPWSAASRGRHTPTTMQQHLALQHLLHKRGEQATALKLGSAVHKMSSHPAADGQPHGYSSHPTPIQNHHLQGAVQ